MRGTRSRSVLGAAIGDCVHVAGLLHFLRIAEDEGYETTFMGAGIPIKDLVGAIVESDPGLVAVSYRLTPEVAARLLAELRDAVSEAGLSHKRYVFGGTLPVCRVAEQVGLFEAIFSGHSQVDEVIAYLRGERREHERERYPESLVERIRAKYPYPLIRHHFGLPSLKETVAGVRRIAESRVLDVISLGPDQNAQACFFRQEEMDHAQDGAGGVPVRSPDDFRALYAASRRGNYPLMRSYSGTRDLIKMAEVLHESIHNAWAAVPLCWYNELDGRGRRRLVEGIREGQETMRWHAARGIPVEVNEAHHWSLRDAHDTVAVAMAYLAAYNAKAAGVRHYVAQYMFDTPPGTSPAMDLAKMLAKVELIESLHDDDFTSFRQTRAGLSSFPADMDKAKGQLASSVMLQMILRPHIVHVVSFSEADHAATAHDVIESCKIARGVVNNCLRGLPAMERDPAVQRRKAELISQVETLLEAIQELRAPGAGDAWTDPQTLAGAVKVGLLDAPHLRGNPAARGVVSTRVIDGACYAIGEDGRPLSEAERIRALESKYAELLEEEPPSEEE